MINSFVVLLIDLLLVKEIVVGGYVGGAEKLDVDGNKK